jgi:hypothetical protein
VIGGLPKDIGCTDGKGLRLAQSVPYHFYRAGYEARRFPRPHRPLLMIMLLKYAATAIKHTEQKADKSNDGLRGIGRDKGVKTFKDTLQFIFVKYKAYEFPPVLVIRGESRTDNPVYEGIQKNAASLQRGYVL